MKLNVCLFTCLGLGLLAGLIATASAATNETSSALDAKIVQLSKPGTTAEEAIRLLGEPLRYFLGEKTYTKTNLPPGYIMVYPQRVYVAVLDGLVQELRCEQPGLGFTWQGKLRLGSTLEEVLQVLGSPSRTEVGKPQANIPGVLYKDIGGIKGNCYYARPEQHIRLFFRSYKVCAIYLPLTD